MRSKKSAAHSCVQSDTWPGVTRCLWKHLCSVGQTAGGTGGHASYTTLMMMMITTKGESRVKWPGQKRMHAAPCAKHRTWGRSEKVWRCRTIKRWVSACVNLCNLSKWELLHSHQQRLWNQVGTFSRWQCVEVRYILWLEHQEVHQTRVEDQPQAVLRNWTKLGGLLIWSSEKWRTSPTV